MSEQCKQAVEAWLIIWNEWVVPENIHTPTEGFLVSIPWPLHKFQFSVILSFKKLCFRNQPLPLGISVNLPQVGMNIFWNFTIHFITTLGSGQADRLVVNRHFSPVPSSSGTGNVVLSCRPCKPASLTIWSHSSALKKSGISRKINDYDVN